MLKLCFKIIYIIKKIKIKIKYFIEKIRPMHINKFNKKLDLSYEDAQKKVSLYRNKRNIIPEIINLDAEIDLSIIIPIYNSEKYIKYCLDSILNQNTKYNIEIICINDGSTDQSLEKILSYEDSRIKIYTQQNSGAAKARNTGINLAIGKYIMFVDSDDFIPDNAIDNLLNTAYDKDADIVTGNINKYISKFDKVICLKKHKSFSTDDLLKMCNMTEGAPWGKIYKKSLWNNVRFHEGQAFEDCIIFLNIYPQVDKFVYINVPVYCFRSTNTSLFKRSINDNVCLDSYWGILDSYNLLRNKEKMSNEHIQLFIWHLSAIMYERIRNLESIKLKIAVVCLSRELIFKMIEQNARNTNIFIGKNTHVYSKLLKTLESGTLEEWEQLSKIILLSGRI